MLQKKKKNKVANKRKNDLIVVSKIENNRIIVNPNTDKKNSFFIKGVNIGAGKPGKFPGEVAITEEEYKRWFRHIKNMNANTIRVYTILSPNFYSALYKFNKSEESKGNKPLYLIHGIWLDENILDKYGDAHAKEFKESLYSDTYDLIDIIHGNKKLKQRYGFASGEYKYDISNYVIGYILGIEWDAYLVDNTNTKNKAMIQFNGNYIYTNNASPFEIFLGELLENTIKFESDKYNTQRPIAFVNWVTTDPLEHPNEPLSELEDKVSIDPNNLKTTSKYKSTMFASYHVYPYYPDGVVHDIKYREYRDSRGKINQYRAYLEDLKKHHNMPIIVSEYGVPASRGSAHVNPYTGYNQGNLTEKQQGEMIVDMTADIYETGYIGALIFTWQDEWFKRTWNNMDFDIPDRRPYWSNYQTNEQNFGIMTFDPGNKRSISYVDGDNEEWINVPILIEENGNKVRILSDEKYLYISLELDSYDIETEEIYIPISTLEKTGNSHYIDKNILFEYNANFLIKIDGENNTKIQVAPYYEHNYKIYNLNRRKFNKEILITTNEIYESKNNGIFVNQNLILNRKLYYPIDKKNIEMEVYETGILKYGNSNPKVSNYNSLADFYIKENFIELKIPWQLLYFADPSHKIVIGDYNEKNDYSFDEIEDIKIGIIKFSKRDELLKKHKILMNTYKLKKWGEPTYHERLRQSYEYVKNKFDKIN